MVADEIEVTVGAGKKLQTHRNVIGLNTVHAEAVVPVTVEGAKAIHKEDDPHVTADGGILLLGVRQDDADTLASADGDYTPFAISEHGCQNVDPQHFKEINCDATAGWSALNNDTTGLTTDLDHVEGTASLEFDKVDGAANTVFGAIQKTLASFSCKKYVEEGGGFILYSINLSTLADVDYVFVRFGTDNANYNEWRIQDDDLTTGWNNLRFPMTRPDTSGSTGNGWDSTAVTYICLGAVFDGQNDVLADIRVDSIHLNSGMQVSSDITAQVSSSVSNPNVNVKKWGAVSVTTDQGVSDTGTLRVAVADDDTNLAAITTAVQILDNVVAGSETQVDIVSPGTAAGSLGKAEDAAASSADVGVAMLAVRSDSPTSRTNVDLDYINPIADEYGRLKILTLHGDTDYKHAFFNAAADGALVALVATKVIKVHAMVLQAAGTVVVNIRTDDAVGTILASWTLQAREGVAGYAFTPYPAHWFQTDAGEALYVDVTAAVNVTINVVYTDDDTS